MEAWLVRMQLEEAQKKNKAFRTRGRIPALEYSNWKQKRREQVEPLRLPGGNKIEFPTHIYRGSVIRVFSKQLPSCLERQREAEQHEYSMRCQRRQWIQCKRCPYRSHFQSSHPRLETPSLITLQTSGLALPSS